MRNADWIWQHPDWPKFTWQSERLSPLLRSCIETQGRLLGIIGAVDSVAVTQNSLDAMLQNIVSSSAIEGEPINVESVRSSLAYRLGIAGENNPGSRSENLVTLLMDAISGDDQPLNEQRLFAWHSWLFTRDDFSLVGCEKIGQLRGEEPMQVISGRLDCPTVHFEAPPRTNLERQLADFLDWLETSQKDLSLDPLLRAGIAHFWFVTLHPFEDGNGRLARIVTDMALAQGGSNAIRHYAMAASILTNRAGYYQVLETRQKGDLNITDWLEWFLTTLLCSLDQALSHLDSILAKTRFWEAYREAGLSSEQIKVLNRLLDGGEKGFEAGISAAQYQALSKVSKATATRHLSDLLEKGCLRRLPGGGRSTRYQINQPGSTCCPTLTLSNA
ncbi:Fic family protein [Pseudomonas sp. PH1b]|uniref:Fic family protein n=1 Tax=Pseudomonas sp. PH1b TaxID=1397282 RepID=UPI0009DD7837|nr:Fic family protein [Pseudomonas sp. PH1b]